MVRRTTGLPQSGPHDRGGASITERRIANDRLDGHRFDCRTDDAHDAPVFDTGTTIVGISATDGVVLAADQRMSLGGRFTANKDVQKVEQVHPRAAMAISGSVGPAQAVVASLRARANLYAARRGSPMSVRALSRTAADLVRGQRMQPLLAGVDEAGEWVFELDGGGSVLEDAYAAGGSGMQVAYGVLERRFESDLGLDSARALATAAVDAASERDTASGDGVTTATITGDGVDIVNREAS